MCRAGRGAQGQKRAGLSVAPLASAPEPSRSRVRPASALSRSAAPLQQASIRYATHGPLQPTSPTARSRPPSSSSVFYPSSQQAASPTTSLHLEQALAEDDGPFADPDILKNPDEEVIMAVEMNGTGPLGCAYYSVVESRLYLLEDMPSTDSDTIEHLIMHIQPTVVLLPTRASTVLVERLEKLAYDGTSTFRVLLLSLLTALL